MSYSVRFNNVSKKYKMHSKSTDKLKDILYPNGFGEEFYALKNVSFEADRGDIIGILGVNGSGKSTMSSLIAGVTPATSGDLEVNGQVSLIAIAAGLNKQLTGRENIELKCLMMGLDKEEIQNLTPEIIDFADIGQFIDMPVKKYSSGMKSRLGFAISVSINPDVLIIDEALSVGDQTFADKCLKRMNEFKEQGKTMFFVSHSLGQIKKFCTKVLWLEHGQVREYGVIQDVLPKYEQFLKEYKGMSKEEQCKFKEEGMKKRLYPNKVIEQKEEGYKKEEYWVSLGAGIGPRNKRKHKKYIVGTSILLLSTIIGCGLYLSKDYLFQKSGAKEQFIEEVKSQEQIKNVNPLESLDIRYINVAKATIRSNPDLDSKSLGIMPFGQSFVVKGKQQNEQSGMNWIKLNYLDGTEGWISEAIVTTIPFNTIIKSEEISPKIVSLIGSSKNMDQILSILDKRREEVGSILGDIKDESELLEGKLVKYSDIDVVYNSQSRVTKVILNKVSFTKDALTAQLGEANLKDEYSAIFVYRSDKFDLLCYLNGNSVNKLEINSTVGLNIDKK
ncbi:TPA: teichoic acids export ABC transporter ATP-binding subunit TagH [Bacillus tropicus]|uniref:teichoic acids export ABC transporter ATP-binding subunit TagH n=1 Tax=Bacillus tropicus TaxID=2026188 RepID=UPI00003CC1C8|nr:teichoic acids export ABC transporter ATP-binding subunit TagH [Bacillus tropicus]AIY74477.1 teichoic acids export ATP-binding TagH domain protein [Bacillus cereus]AJI03580.1 teichoic acids export ATP-binding TagH domain protein [Bacillus cereus G9241]PED54204.1 teichoic acid ABC transporter ATP-binding protein [Bacillus anthracis]ARO20906.1 teichoic acid ABC transporter ATP-binding protein [Bacillus cereus]EAL12331.1 teichoic acid translocation ATP-binding protein [Bacillus cereus G9241]